MKKIICWILVILWMSVIFIFSSYNGEKSTNQSKGFLYHTIGNIITFFDSDIDENRKDEIIDTLDPIVRKLAHGTEYFILALFVCLALNNYDISNKRIMIYSLLICFLYSCSDEIHQLFVSNRSAQITDILIDTFGSLIETLLFIKIKK